MSFIPLKGDGLRGLMLYPIAPFGAVDSLVLELHTDHGLLGASLTHGEASSLRSALDFLLMSPCESVGAPSGFYEASDPPVSPVGGGPSQS